jgi:hypothetical protein
MLVKCNPKETWLYCLRVFIQDIADYKPGNAGDAEALSTFVENANCLLASFKGKPNMTAVDIFEILTRAYGATMNIKGRKVTITLPEETDSP